MPNFTPVYILPFIKAGEPVTEVMERTRYMAIDRQLESLFTFLGDGVMSGWEIIPHPTQDGYIIVRPGSGVVNKLAIASNREYEFSLPRVDNTDTLYYVYVKLLPHSPHTAVGNILTSTTELSASGHLVLGKVNVTGNIISTSNIDTTENSGRVQLTFLRYLVESISNHVHTGAPGEPDKIDLFNHVKGILSSAHIQDLPASKITSGIFDKERFRISHNDLSDVGTLTHSQIDSLISKFQNINKLLFGDLMTSNLIQLILSLKHVWGDVDEYFYNFFALIPGIDNNKFLNSQSFIDLNASSAEIDFLNHEIRGKYVQSKEIGQYVINTVSEFSVDGSGGVSYDSKYIEITGVVGDYGYGYGFGFGEGLDYFDVLWGPYDDSGNLTEGVVGTGVGYGIGEFESTFAGEYGYGYGYEQFTGFPTTLTSTKIRLVPNSSFRDLHDKDIDNGGIVLKDDYDMTYYNVTNTDSNKPDLYQFLVMAADDADVNNEKRDTTNMVSFSSNVYVGSQALRLDTDQSVTCLLWDRENILDMTKDDNYIYFILAQTRYMRGTNGSFIEIPDFTSYTGSFDRYWSADVSLDLILEATVDRSGTLYRVFFKYTGGDFLDITNNRLFDTNRFYADGYVYGVDVPALARIQAHIVEDNITELCKYTVTDATGRDRYTVDEAQVQIDAAVAITVLKQEMIENITGIYLYSKNDVDISGSARSYCLDFLENVNKAIHFPMGQRNDQTKAGFSPNTEYFGANLTEDGNPGNSSLNEMQYAYGEDDYNPISIGTKVYRESSMLVDIDRIYVGGTPGFRYSPTKNVVKDITVTFPDPVALNSLSWISSEPSDSLCYIQIKRLDSLDGVDLNYNRNIIYTNKGTILNNALEYNYTTLEYNNPENIADWLGWIDSSDADYAEQMADKYKVSGSDFPSEYNSVRSLSLQIVLLPSTDLNVTPVFNSITINYTSNTSEGNLVISSKDDWSLYRSESNITTGSYVSGGTEIDYVTIDVPTESGPAVGKIKNLIYGSNGAIVEVGNQNGTWLDAVKVFTGNGPLSTNVLPLTVKQYFEGSGAMISGYVTHLQKRDNGNIIFLDQDSSRVVELDMNYNIHKIVASEYAYKNTDAKWMPSSLDAVDRKVSLLRTIYNGSLGENGVLYLVFSHELKAWNRMYGKDSNTYDPTVIVSPDTTAVVDLSKFYIIVDATEVTFETCEVVVCDRGILCIKLDSLLGNFIAGNASNEIRYVLNTEEITVGTETKRVLSAVGSCVGFKGINESAETFIVGRVPIEKPSYSLIYAPIQGIVAFDIDSDENLYILKKTRPYPYSTTDAENTYDESGHAAEPWYVKMSTTALWDKWKETTGSNSGDEKTVFPIANFRSDNLWEPVFYLNGIYGYRGSIQSKDSYLLITISGEKDASGNANGVFMFKRRDSSVTTGHLYGGPEDFNSFLDSDTVPMSTKIDPVSYDDDTKIFTSIYVALSNLKKSSAIDSKSKVIKINNITRMVEWEWGTKEDKNNGVSNSFALVVNDVNMLSYNETEVIVST